MLAVIDTNILVSALWSMNGTPAQVVGLILNSETTPCYDHRIMEEYHKVLNRPKFGFAPAEINDILDWFEKYGQSVVPLPLKEKFVDESDKKFYEVAKYCKAILITGNIKHYPPDSIVTTVDNFLASYSQ